MDDKHTPDRAVDPLTSPAPGPWMQGAGTVKSAVYDMNFAAIAETFGPNKNKNAKLIAAAPELLEALKVARGTVLSMGLALGHWSGPIEMQAYEQTNGPLQLINSALQKAGAGE